MQTSNCDGGVMKDEEIVDLVTKLRSISANETASY